MVDAPYPRVLLVALALATGLALVVTGATSTVGFGAFNPAWDGTSDLRAIADDGAETRIARNVSTYSDVTANDTLAIVLSPASAYENPAPVRQFVTDGGTLLVAEDYRPHTNTLLAAVGATARVDGRALRDERTHGASPAFPRATNVTDHPLTTNVSALVLNHGTSIRPAAATVLVRTSPYGYLDTDGDSELDDAETLAAHPVATVEPVGDGRVVVLGDPSVLINAMLDSGDNRAFAQTLVAAHDRVLLDVSHAGALPVLTALHLTLQDSPWLQVGLGTLLVGLVLRWRWLATRVQAVLARDPPPEPRLDAPAVRAHVALRHPDWDETRVARVTEAIMARRPQSGANDRSE